MLDFDLSVRLRIGGSDFESDSNQSLLSRIKTRIVDSFSGVFDLIEFIKNDDEINYRITFDEGNDAYMLLYDKNYPEGFYGNSNNPNDLFYKSYSAEGNSIAAFVIPDVYVQNTVQRMEGVQMTPTDTLQSQSIAEIYITNCDDANIDPYIPLRISYDQKGIATVWYGRNSKFKAIPEYFEAFEKSLELEYQSVNEWLDRYVEEEPDLIDLMAIKNMEEMMNSIENNNRRKRRRVHNTRN